MSSWFVYKSLCSFVFDERIPRCLPDICKLQVSIGVAALAKQSLLDASSPLLYFSPPLEQLPNKPIVFKTLLNV